MVDRGVLAAIEAAIGFGIVAFVFRIQRELQVEEALLREWREEADQRGISVTEEELLEKAATYRWIPWADRLLVGNVTVALLLVLLPIALAGNTSNFWGGQLPAAGCSAPHGSTGGLRSSAPGPLPVRSPSRSQMDLVRAPVRSLPIRSSTGGKGHCDRIGHPGRGIPAAVSIVVTG